LFLTIVVALFLAMTAIMWRAVTVPFTLMWTYAIALLVFSAAVSFPHILKSRRITDFFADISFPLYVVHGVLGYAILRVVAGVGVPAWLCVLIAAVASIAVATALHYGIEMPSHKIGRRLALSTKGTPATSGGATIR
jgi:peptidoglycan/LPS O-acetylase OafA/YrhL